jgi:hypothetical protein
MAKLDLERHTPFLEQNPAFQICKCMVDCKDNKNFKMVLCLDVSHIYLTTLNRTPTRVNLESLCLFARFTWNK